MSSPVISETEIGTRAAGHRVLELPRCALLALNGPFRGTEMRVDRESFRIGKSAEADWVLDDATVSRLHCEIVRDGTRYLLRDLGSTNGTLLDGAQIREAYLSPGAVVTVGNIELRVQSFSERIEILPSDKAEFGEAVGRSVAMREIFGVLERLAPSNATVLLGGETGCGKDVLARSIHAASPRAGRPFIVVDCGAVVGTLIESELFGHERGSFTGATNQRQGAFELADGGTLFLDEIGELPLDLQPKLLRAIEQRTFRRVGGAREIRVDIRIVAASKRNLRAEVARGKFREDLYFRLAVVPIEVPPLRERREDIPPLVDHLLAKIARTTGMPMRIAPGLVDVLSAHDWPGNVRELRNVLERAAYVAQASGQDEVRLVDFPLSTGTAGSLGNVSGPEAGTSELSTFRPDQSYRETKAQWDDEFERRYVTWLLARHHGNISAAARAADMDRKYLHKLAKKHGVHPSGDKPS